MTEILLLLNYSVALYVGVCIVRKLVDASRNLRHECMYQCKRTGSPVLKLRWISIKSDHSSLCYFDWTGSKLCEGKQLQCSLLLLLLVLLLPLLLISLLLLLTELGVESWTQQLRLATSTLTQFWRYIRGNSVNDTSLYWALNQTLFSSSDIHSDVQSAGLILEHSVSKIYSLSTGSYNTVYRPIITHFLFYM